MVSIYEAAWHVDDLGREWGSDGRFQADLPPLLLLYKFWIEHGHVGQTNFRTGI